MSTQAERGRFWLIQPDRERFPQALARYLVELPSEGSRRRRFLIGLIALGEGDPTTYPDALYEIVVAPISPNVDIPDPENWTPAGLIRPVIVCEQFGNLDDAGAGNVALAIAHLMVEGDLLPHESDAPVFKHTIWCAVERLNGFAPTSRVEKGA